MNRTTGAPAQRRATPRRSALAVRTIVDARVRIVHPVDRNLVDAQAAPLSADEQLGVEEPFVVAHVGQQVARGGCAQRLEAALRVAEARAQDGPEDRVVAA